MDRRRIEMWCRDVIERVEKGQPVEDSRVELKARWPDQPFKAARRLAGHYNAARGDDILWLIGVDERNKSVPGADKTETANWLSTVSALFDGDSPEVIDLALKHNEVSVCALLFTTDRSPYVVKNPAKGTDAGEVAELEVPWRDGTRVRSARRSELLSIILPPARVPEVEVLHAAIRPGNVGFPDFAKLYLAAEYGSHLTIPFHRCRVTVLMAEKAVSEQPLTIRPPLHNVLVAATPRKHSGSDKHFRQEPHSATVRAGMDQVILEGPGQVIVEWQSKLPEDVLETYDGVLRVNLSLASLELPRPLEIEIGLAPAGKHTWVLKSGKPSSLRAETPDSDYLPNASVVE